MAKKSCGCIVMCDEKTLLVRTAYGKHWMWPKGRQHKGESERECAMRETREETGLEKLVLIDGFSHEFAYTNKDVPRDSAGFGKKIVVYLAMTPELITPTFNSQEIAEAKWVPINKAVEVVTRESAKYAMDQAVKFMKRNYYG